MRSKAEPIYREFELVNFFRQFELTDEVDQEKITARINHGVLILELPKAEKAKPRQIPRSGRKGSGLTLCDDEQIGGLSMGTGRSSANLVRGQFAHHR